MKIINKLSNHSKHVLLVNIKEYIVEQRKSDRMGKVLSISNHKGGVGKQLCY
jgi:hypothetical protein